MFFFFFVLNSSKLLSQVFSSHFQVESTRWINFIRYSSFFKIKNQKSKTPINNFEAQLKKPPWKTTRKFNTSRNTSTRSSIGLCLGQSF